MIASLDLDDFSVLRNGFNLLFSIKEHFPDFKVSLFTIPYDYEMEMSTQRLYRDKALQMLHDNLSWMQIIPHGLTHIPAEFEKADYKTTEISLKAIADIFARDQIPYEKGFKAPYWLWNRHVTRCLDDHGYWGAVDRNQPDMERTKRTFTYTHSIHEPFFKSTNNVLNLHGHIGKPSENNLQDCLLNILKLPTNTEWKFASEFVKDAV